MNKAGEIIVNGTLIAIGAAMQLSEDKDARMVSDLADKAAFVQNTQTSYSVPSSPSTEISAGGGKDDK